MRAAEVTIGRTFVVAFDHGEDFYPPLHAFCTEHGIRQGYIPTFIAGLSTAELVGTCERLEDPAAPVWSRVHLRNVEALGAGTLAVDLSTSDVLPHIHVSIGLKEHSATVQFLVEMVIVEVISPTLTRTRQPDLYDVPLLGFQAGS